MESEAACWVLRVPVDSTRHGRAMGIACLRQLPQRNDRYRTLAIANFMLLNLANETTV